MILVHPTKLDRVLTGVVEQGPEDGRMLAMLGVSGATMRDADCPCNELKDQQYSKVSSRLKIDAIAVGCSGACLVPAGCPMVGQSVP